MDFDTIIDAVPGSPKTKATIALGAIALYGVAMFARGFFREGSIGLKVCDIIINGLKPRPAKPQDPEAKPPVAPAMLVLVLGSLLFATPARADGTSLSAIGKQGNWSFGFLPTVQVVGVDVRHGKVVGSFTPGLSLAATWMEGQLKSITVGAHGSAQLGTEATPQTANVGGSLSFLKGHATVIFDYQAIGGDHAFVVAPVLGFPFSL